jgi:hypothetical protein
MDMITEDKWDEDIWGVEHVDTDAESGPDLQKTDQKGVPKLVFYFGHSVSYSIPTIPSSVANNLTRIQGPLGGKPHA